MAGFAGLRAAIKAGINVMTTANSHAAEHSEPGIADTLRNLEAPTIDELKALDRFGKGNSRYQADTFDLDGGSDGLAAVVKVTTLPRRAVMDNLSMPSPWNFSGLAVCLER